MARIRTIKPEFWEDEKIAKLTMPCRLFFIGTWSYADDAGVFRANAALLKSKIFPYDDIRTSEIQKHLDALVEARMILPISHNGESFYVIRTFRSHQKFDARFPNHLIDSEVLRDLMGAPPQPSVDPSGTQCVPAKGGGGGRGMGKGNIPPLPPKGESACWRTDFETYKKELREAYRSAVADTSWLDQRRRYHPNLDIELTLERACAEYWATEAGWLHKRKSKSGSINWRSTFCQTLEKNKVYKQKNDPQTNETQVF